MNVNTAMRANVTHRGCRRMSTNASATRSSGGGRLLRTTFFCSLYVSGDASCSINSMAAQTWSLSHTRLEEHNNSGHLLLGRLRVAPSAVSCTSRLLLHGGLCSSHRLIGCCPLPSSPNGCRQAGLAAFSAYAVTYLAVVDSKQSLPFTLRLV